MAWERIRVRSPRGARGRPDPARLGQRRGQDDGRRGPGPRVHAGRSPGGGSGRSSSRLGPAGRADDVRRSARIPAREWGGGPGAAQTVLRGQDTARAGPRASVDVSFFGDPSSSPNGPQTTAAMLNNTTGAFDALAYGGDQQIIHYQGLLAPTSLLEASPAGHTRPCRTRLPSTSGRSPTRRSRPIRSPAGRGPTTRGSEGTSLQYEAKATQLFGSHEIRFGGSYESTE